MDKEKTCPALEQKAQLSTFHILRILTETKKSSDDKNHEMEINICIN